MTAKRIFKRTLFVLGAVILLGLGAGFGLWLLLRGSLPALDGEMALSGLSAPVVVERDALGVPTVRAANRMDAARATGFLHAQERFFQMDLMRRTAAGELAELIGAGVIDRDRAIRLHRLRAVAKQVHARLSEEEKGLLAAYVDGVNDGLAQLGARPPEYFALRTEPAAWSPEDSVLAAYTMFVFLQDETGEQDAAMGVLRKVLPQPAFEFFVPLGTSWDAPLDDIQLPVPPVPTPDQFSFSKLVSHANQVPVSNAFREELYVGSNSWAVDGKISRTGSALVANDTHLSLRLPNTWYRMRIVCPGEAGRRGLDITGVTLPGTPAMIVGSNGSIAWAFTNSMVDTTDLIELEVRTGSPMTYRTPDGWRPFEEVKETVKIKGAESAVITVLSTTWGPVLKDAKGNPKWAIRWVAHSPEAANFGLIQLEQVQDVNTALMLAPLCGIPLQNFVVGDRQGRIGWTLMGRLPKRMEGSGETGMFPIPGALAGADWDGWLAAEQYPRYQEPEDGRIWTANNRIAGSPDYLNAGPWVTDLGSRAGQIRDGLRRLKTAGPSEMLRIQLDDRAKFLERWQALLLSTLESGQVKSRADLAAVKDAVKNWGGHASVNSVGYRLTRGFRRFVIEMALDPITKRCRQLEPDFYYPTPQVEAAVWTLLEQKPGHLLNPEYRSFESLLTRAVDRMLEDLEKQGVKPAEATWGARNTLVLHHPLSLGVPALGRWLDLPAEQLPGDSHMPRVQSDAHGASKRLAVSPGHESEGFFHMPGGQSGHFMSPYYSAGHDAWANGKPLPFLPGPTQHTLRLRP